jgi:hypothetical protein
MELLKPRWESENKKEALRAIEALTDQEELAKAAKTAPDWKVRKVAIEKLTDQSVLDDMARNDKDIVVREVARRKLAVLKGIVLTDQKDGNRQKWVVLIGAGIGILATFLPWEITRHWILGEDIILGIKFGNGFAGIINILLFGTLLILGLCQRTGVPTNIRLLAGSVFVAVLAGSFGLLIRTLVLSSWVDRYIATGVGLWLIILAGFGTAILSIIFKWKFK